jgi:holo-[acyl-carrier protein] synthase
MDIIGSGLDAIEIGRVAEALRRHGDRFIRRLFTAGEQAYCHAKRDAASSVHWVGIEVVRHHGPPQLQFHDGAARRFAALGATRSLLTLTHSRELAIAHVLLFRD